MSSSKSSLFSLTGGVPLAKQDFAASIIFAVAFLLLIPLAFFRWARSSTRTTLLITPTTVAHVRVATFVIRAIISKGNYSDGLFIAEQVFLLVGLVPLVVPIVGLLRAHVRRNWVPEAHNEGTQKRVNILGYATRSLQLAVLVALILGIVAGAEAGSATTDSAAASRLKTFRYASTGLVVGVLASTILLALSMHRRENLPPRGTGFLLLVASILLIPSLYKLIAALHPPSPLSDTGKVVFYVLSPLPEVLSTALFLSVDLNQLFALKEAKWKGKVERRMKKGSWPVGLGYVDEADSDGMETAMELQGSRSGPMMYGKA